MSVCMNVEIKAITEARYTKLGMQIFIYEFYLSAMPTALPKTRHSI